MKYIEIFVTLLVLGFGLCSCQKELEVGDAGAKILSGDWVVKEYDLKWNELYGPYTIQIYNTSFDTDSISVENIYDSSYKVKCKKLSETTFAVKGGADITRAFENTIDVSEAKVVGEDSIIFRVVLYNEDGSINDDYYEAGHRYTGWEED
jgi:hypothetical protein